MEYKVLYRKYRPQTFSEIIGQNNIVNILKSSILDNKISHAYIFTGPRGTGKTSTAKVFAKAVNCMASHNGEPCNECENCHNFSSSPDVIEIDAASNNGVDEIRELRNNITILPTSNRYKVYIIDEVHMLTTGAFNALLKTLEEPPEHVIFILATTEIYKIPITILSRCQRYDFKKINIGDMVQHLSSICDKEKILTEPDVLKEIYFLSDGCVRDALGILDQLSKKSKKITLDYIEENYSIINEKIIEKLFDYIKIGNIKGVIDIIEKYENSGVSGQNFIKKAVYYLEKKAVELKISCDINFVRVSNLIKQLCNCYADAKTNENIYTIIKLLFLEQIDDKKVNVQSTTYSNSEARNDTNCSISNKFDIESIRINNCFAGANKNDLIELKNNWGRMNFILFNNVENKVFNPVASSKEYAIFVTEDESLASLFNIKYVEIDELLLRKGIEIKPIAVSAKRWENERNTFKENLKKQKKYVILEEPKIDTSHDDNMKNEAAKLFDKELIEIK